MKKTLSGKKHILLAEDDTAISEVVSIILRDEKYAVTVPSDFADLQKLIENKVFDLILLDVILWGENGAELCKKLKANIQTKNTPVILLSARNDARFIAGTVGADDTVEKPFEINLLLDRIKKNLK